MNKVISVGEDFIEFDNGLYLESYHQNDCCEHHYLYFKDLDIDDFKGLEFDLIGEDFFERVEGYGIELKPIVGHPVRIPGYGSNNGYYSSNLSLVLTNRNGNQRVFDISECQVIND